jgi:hypothetical protein
MNTKKFNDSESITGSNKKYRQQEIMGYGQQEIQEYTEVVTLQRSNNQSPSPTVIINVRRVPTVRLQELGDVTPSELKSLPKPLLN